MSLSVRWFGVLLGLLVAVGVGLRFHDLDQRSLWADDCRALASPMILSPVFTFMGFGHVAGRIFLLRPACWLASQTCGDRCFIH